MTYYFAPDAQIAYGFARFGMRRRRSPPVPIDPGLIQ
jgi:hypothetical protein